MEAVVHEPLGHVLGLDARTLLERPQIHDALVGHAAILAPIHHGIVRLQPLGDVVGIEDGEFGGALESLRAHQARVGPRDEQNVGAAPGRCRDRADGVASAHWHHGMARQKLHQVTGHRDGPHARAATAMGAGKGLVQIDVADVSADVGRPTKPDLAVHVGAVHVHLAAVLVHDGAQPLHALLEHAVSRGIGEHERGEMVLVLDGLGFQIRFVDVASGVAGHAHDLEPGHDRRRWVGAVGRRRNQAHVAMALAASSVIATNHQQAGVLALRARIGLQRHAPKTGDRRQNMLQLAE